AVLSPWPAQRGYLLSPTGRALAAFDTDLDGRIRPYLDETTYRDAAATLLPATAAATTSLLDLLWPAWPQTRRDGADALRITAPEWSSATLTVMVEAGNGERRGERRIVGRHPLTVADETRVELGTGTLAEGERVVLLLEAQRLD